MKKMLGMILACSICLGGCAIQTSEKDMAVTAVITGRESPAAAVQESQNLPDSKLYDIRRSLIPSADFSVSDRPTVLKKTGEDEQILVHFLSEEMEERNDDQQVIFTGHYTFPTFTAPVSGGWLNRQAAAIRENTLRACDEVIRQARADEAEQPDRFYPYSCYVETKSARIDGKVVSLLQMNSIYSGGAHPNNTRSAFNFDLSAQKQLSLRDILLPGASDQLLEQVLSQIESRVASVSGLYPEYRQVIEKQFRSRELTPEWYFSPNSLVIYFNCYDIAPYAAGVIEVEFPYTQLGGILLPRYFPDAAAAGEPVFSQSPEDKKITSLCPHEAESAVYLGTDSSLSQVQIFAVSGWLDDHIPVLGSQIFSANYLSNQEFLEVPGDIGFQFLLFLRMPDGRAGTYLISEGKASLIFNLFVNQS